MNVLLHSETVLPNTLCLNFVDRRFVRRARNYRDLYEQAQIIILSLYARYVRLKKNEINIWYCTYELGTAYTVVQLRYSRIRDWQAR
jgi:hypothetical protein